MTKQSWILAGLAGLAFTATAAAEDGPARRPTNAAIAARAHDWTGFHAGVHAGYGWNAGGVGLAAANFDAQFYLDSTLVPRSPIARGKGALGGGQIGYDVQAGRIVYGFEADLSLADIRAGDTTDNYFLATFQTVTAQKLGAFGTLRARLGVTPFERTLLYVTGGLAFGRATLSSSVTSLDVTGTPFCGAASGLCAAGSTTKWIAGWTVGGGWEQALAGRWSAKIEGLYYDLGGLSHDFDDPTAVLGLSPIFHASADFRGHLIRVGVNYRFD